jgi:hypothetical protein
VMDLIAAVLAAGRDLPAGQQLAGEQAMKATREVRQPEARRQGKGVAAAAALTPSAVMVLQVLAATGVQAYRPQSQELP